MIDLAKQSVPSQVFSLVDFLKNLKTRSQNSFEDVYLARRTVMLGSEGLMTQAASTHLGILENQGNSLVSGIDSFSLALENFAWGIQSIYERIEEVRYQAIEGGLIVTGNMILPPMLDPSSKLVTMPQNAEKQMLYNRLESWMKDERANESEAHRHLLETCTNLCSEGGVLSRFDIPVELLSTDELRQRLAADAKKAGDAGLIDRMTQNALVTGLLNLGRDVLIDLAKDGLIAEVINRAVANMASNIPMYNMGGVLVNGGVMTIPLPDPVAVATTVKVARYGVPILTSAIDFAIQVGNGENPVDAGIKTGGHLAAGLLGAKIGTAIPIPFVGTAVGFAVGFGGSMLFDWAYDKFDISEKVGTVVEGVSNVVGNAIDSVGDAVDSVAGAVGDAVDAVGDALGGVWNLAFG